MTRYLLAVAVLVLVSAAAFAFWAAPDGRRGRHVAPPRLRYIDRFYATRYTIYIGHARPTLIDFADIAAANSDVDLDFGTYADLYLVPEETR